MADNCLGLRDRGAPAAVAKFKDNPSYSPSYFPDNGSWEQLSWRGRAFGRQLFGVEEGLTPIGVAKSKHLVFGGRLFGVEGLLADNCFGRRG